MPASDLRDSQRLSSLWLGAVVALSFVFHALVLPPRDPGLGVLASRSVIYAVIAWSVFRLANYRHARNGEGLMAFLCILASMMCGGWTGARLDLHHQRRELQDLQAFMEKEFRYLNEEGPQPDPMPRSILKPPTPLLRQGHDCIQELNRIRETYRGELEAQGFQTLENLEGIEHIGALENRQIRIENMIEISRRFVSASAEVITKALLARDEEARMLGFDPASLPTSFDWQEVREGLELDSKIFGHHLALNRGLLASRGHWKVEGDVLLFERDSDREAFDREATAIVALHELSKERMEAKWKIIQKSLEEMERKIQ